MPNFKGKVVIFTVQSLILHRPVDLATSVELYFKSSKYLEMGKFGLVEAMHLSKQFFPDAEHLKVKKPFYVREMRMHLNTLNSFYVYPC